MGVILCCSFFTQAQNDKDSIDDIEIPDISASYPGGMEAFHNYLEANMVYPRSARINGIEGKVFVSFVVGRDGMIEQPTVKIVVGLSTVCNLEAIRVIKSNTVRWRPGQKSGKSIRQLFVFPMYFVLTDSKQFRGPFETVNSIKALVIPSTSENINFGWNIYSDIDLYKRAHRAMPGDSLEIIGRAPWLYLVDFKSGVGFISYKALSGSQEIKSMSETLSRESPDWQASIDRQDSLKQKRQEQIWQPLVEEFGVKSGEDKVIRKEDSLELASNPLTLFRLTTSKKRLSLGECAVIDLSFYVSEQNQIPLQFSDLGKQIAKMSSTSLRNDYCWIASNNVENIVDTKKRIGNQTYFIFNIYKASYCPFKALPILFEPIKLEMAQMKLDDTDEVEKLISFKTRALTIPVDPLPEKAKPTSNELFKLSGDFIATDTVFTQTVRVGDPVKYQLTISGQGLTFPLQAHQLKDVDFSCAIIDQYHSDTIINNNYYSRKTFTYSIVFNKTGTFDVSDKIFFLSFSPKAKKVIQLRGKTRVTVEPDHQSNKILNPNTSGKNQKDIFVVIDISRSMQIEDYTPNRLGAVQDGLIEFFKYIKECKMGLVVFGEDALQIDADDECYSEALIRSLDQELVRQGTAIGDALWFSLFAMNHSDGNKKKIVIIGDGDNTAGFLTPTAASKLALKYKVAIYTIGVGNRGLVKFGDDYFGKPVMVEDTFSDKDLKKISLITGGKYFWAKDAAAVTKILNEIVLY